MYLTTVARSLGAQPWRPIRRPPLPKPKPCVPRCYTDSSGRTVCVDCWPPPAMHGLGTSAACSDAGTGLLTDCWKQAESALGVSLDQAQLNRVATAYQQLTRPGSLAGLGRWVFDGRKMVWQGMSGMGEEVLAPDPLTIAKGNKQVVPQILVNFPPVLPQVSADTLLKAAQLPNAPAIVKQAAAQLPQQAGVGSGIGDLLTGEWISGVPNYLLLGGGLLALVLLGRRKR